MYSKVMSGALHGVEGRLITVEADVRNGLPSFNMVGFLASEVREASDRVKSALSNSGFLLDPKKITINLSPADLRKEGSIHDLSIAVAVLAAYGYIPSDEMEDVIFLGELSLNGDVRGVRGILPIVDFAKKNKVKKVILPLCNCNEASYIKDIKIYGVNSLNEVINHLIGTDKLKPIPSLVWKANDDNQFSIDFSDVKGQKLVKRATEIAVAGMHNILYVGAPGSGKSMIAKRIPTIMPKLTYEESINITKIYSARGMIQPEEGLLSSRPFRMPHHSITAQALIGGGKVPRPGEVSLAHRGVLFLDEFLEFQKNIIDMMRQPMEDGKITIARLQGSYTFPCEFMLVAAMNPCPCGFYPDRKRCRCNQLEIERYQKRISGPMMDRIDMNISVRKLEYQEIFSDKIEEKSEEIRNRIIRAHSIQKKRLKGFHLLYNSQIPSNQIESFCGFGEEEQKLKEELFCKNELSARGMMKLLKVARTIADLDEKETVSCDHLWEAFTYRMNVLGGEY